MQEEAPVGIFAEVQKARHSKINLMIRKVKPASTVNDDVKTVEEELLKLLKLDEQLMHSFDEELPQQHNKEAEDEHLAQQDLWQSKYSTGSTDEDIDGIPDDPAKYLFRVSAGKLGHEDTNLNMPSRTARGVTKETELYSHDGIVQRGDKIDMELLEDHDALDLLDEDSEQSADFSSEDLSGDELEAAAEIKQQEKLMKAAAGRGEYTTAGELQARIKILRRGICKRRSSNPKYAQVNSTQLPIQNFTKAMSIGEKSDLAHLTTTSKDGVSKERIDYVRAVSNCSKELALRNREIV